MSLINDALKRAQQQSTAAPPASRSFPGADPRPAAPRKSKPLFVWLLLVLGVFTVAAVVFAVGRAQGQRTADRPLAVTARPEVVVAPAPVAEAPSPVPAALPAPVAPPPVPAPVNPPAAPKLQGILYSPTAPAAIIGGATVRPGDLVQSYRVKEITKNSVTLTGTDGKDLRLRLGN